VVVGTRTCISLAVPAGQSRSCEIHVTLTPILRTTYWTRPELFFSFFFSSFFFSFFGHIFLEKIQILGRVYSLLLSASLAGGHDGDDGDGCNSGRGGNGE
jgi:hypothetical protein